MHTRVKYSIFYNETIDGTIQIRNRINVIFYETLCHSQS